MTRSNGHLNGGGDRNDRDNVTSLEEARRRAAERAKAEKRAARMAGVGATGPRGWRDWVIGGLVVAMAIGYLASFFMGTPQLTRGGVQ